MQKGSYTNLVLAERTTFAEIIERYIVEVLPTMRGGKADFIRLKALARRPISRLSMVSLTPQKIAQHRDERLKKIAPATVIRELSYFSSIITFARKEWGININNPVALVARPKNPQGRSRILDAAETNALFEALSPSGRRSIWMLPLVRLALETAMRRSELLGLRWEHVDFGRRTIFLRCTTKSSHTKEQCKRPASKLSKTSKCSSHGGLSTGPKTQVGKDSIRAAHFKHGQETKEAKAVCNEKRVMFRYLTDIGNHCNMFYKKLSLEADPLLGIPS